MSDQPTSQFPTSPASGGASGSQPFLKRKGVQLAGAGLLGLVLGVGLGGGGEEPAGADGERVAALEQQLEQAQQDVERLTDERDQQTLRGNQIAEAAASAAAAAPAAPAAPAPEQPAAAPAQGQLADGSFTSTTPVLEDDGLGDFGGAARVTNTSDEEKTGVFTYTFFVGDELVGTAQASADAVGPGETATVQLLSTDDFREGVDRIEFQVDLES